MADSRNLKYRNRIQNVPELQNVAVLSYALFAFVSHKIFHYSHHPSPLYFFTPGLKLFFLQIISTIAYHFFFWTDSTDSPDGLPILLSISVFTIVFLFLHC